MIARREKDRDGAGMSGRLEGRCGARPVFALNRASVCAILLSAMLVLTNCGGGGGGARVQPQAAVMPETQQPQQPPPACPPGQVGTPPNCAAPPPLPPPPPPTCPLGQVGTPPNCTAPPPPPQTASRFTTGLAPQSGISTPRRNSLPGNTASRTPSRTSGVWRPSAQIRPTPTSTC